MEKKDELNQNVLSSSSFAKLGIIVWRAQKIKNVSTIANLNEPLNTLAQCVSTCTRCALSKTRTQPVFGQGNPNAKLMLIGEAPGFYEDQQGLPFVGASGQLLNNILKAIQLNRMDVYIANILKCRPPNNRDPQAEEIAACANYLIQQIQFIQPKHIVALGRIAAHYLLQTTQSLESLRGRNQHSPILNQNILVTYHPAYLLRNPKDKAKAWKDWQMIRDQLLAI